MNPIVHIPSAVLSTRAKEVKAFDKKLLKIIADMKKRLSQRKIPKGSGSRLRKLVFRFAYLSHGQMKNRNTSIYKSRDYQRKNDDDPPSRNASEGHGKMEGCLSVPNLWGKVHRQSEITLAFLDEKGVAHENVFSGFLSTIIQHETDHINGILFVQRVLEQKGKLLK